MWWKFKKPNKTTVVLIFLNLLRYKLGFTMNKFKSIILVVKFKMSIK